MISKGLKILVSLVQLRVWALRFGVFPGNPDLGPSAYRAPVAPQCTLCSTQEVHGASLAAVAVEFGLSPREAA